ncbi:hypothetical protein TUM19329_23820 [Legionella antarctica]|uniref:Fido domain-containing protein n=1 Tax=Legionella antarctica TaxID=2708020 RepID=A0A6F8T6E1_9GAMM|nr:hypothetical protein [Legionella antarctica]BCA96021.1 hypothetical protein TUM19329_23820 [Legionella antarctica]
MIYIVIKNLPHLLKTNNPLQHIKDTLTKIKPKLVFMSEIEAAQYIESEYKVMSPQLMQSTSYGLVELDTDKSNFYLLQSESKLVEVLKAIIIKGKRMDAQLIEVEEHEKQQLAEMNYEEINPQDMLLTEPYPCSLLKIPGELRFLCFIDYALFHHYLENWIAYNTREPGSVLDLFNTQANICRSIFSEKSPEPLSIKHIRDLQASLSFNLFQTEKSKSGKLRDGFNSFPISRDAINVEGAIELLKRIKNENNENGFMIGAVKHFEIVHIYCMQLSNASRERYLSTKLPLTFQKYNEIFTEIKASALKNTIKKVIEQNPHIRSDALEQIINSFLKESKIEEQFLNEEKYKPVQLDSLSAYTHNIAMRAKLVPTKVEMAFELGVARENAWISHTTLKNTTDEELETIAKQLVTSVKDTSLSLLTPDPVSAEEKAKMAIDRYNVDINTAKTPDDVILCIVTLVHELEILHVFHDVNCRTNYFLLNEQLIKHGLKPAILYNPNRLDCYNIASLVNQVKQGICRYDYVMTNSVELFKMNESITGTKKSSDKLYEIISSQLTEVITDFNDQYQMHINNLEKILLRQTPSSSGLFSSRVNTGMIEEIKMLFEQFKIDQNLLSFITGINQMPRVELNLIIGKEFLDEFDRLIIFSQINSFCQFTCARDQPVQQLNNQIY